MNDVVIKMAVRIRSITVCAAKKQLSLERPPFVINRTISQVLHQLSLNGRFKFPDPLEDLEMVEEHKLWDKKMFINMEHADKNGKNEPENCASEVKLEKTVKLEASDVHGNRVKQEVLIGVKKEKTAES